MSVIMDYGDYEFMNYEILTRARKRIVFITWPGNKVNLDHRLMINLLPAWSLHLDSPSICKEKNVCLVFGKHRILMGNMPPLDKVKLYADAHERKAYENEDYLDDKDGDPVRKVRFGGRALGELEFRQNIEYRYRQTVMDNQFSRRNIKFQEANKGYEDNLEYESVDKQDFSTVLGFWKSKEKKY